jgi:WD40 repeat protein
VELALGVLVALVVVLLVLSVLSTFVAYRRGHPPAIPAHPDERQVRRAVSRLKSKRPSLMPRRHAAAVLSAALEVEPSPVVAVALAETLMGRSEPEVVAIAHRALVNMPPHQAQPAIDAICAHWMTSQAEPLRALIVEGQWIAQSPVETRVATGLISNQSSALRAISADGVDALIRAMHETDAEMAKRAKDALAHLHRADARERVCDVVLDGGPAALLDLVKAAKYVPGNEDRRAVFLFLTDQWERYEALDFDHALLRAAYEASTATDRLRIAEKIRESGRTQLLTVIAGGDFRSRVERMSALETQQVLRTLTSNREWQRLWSLAFEFSFQESLEILKTLFAQSWRPTDSEEAEIYSRLMGIVQLPMTTTVEEVTKVSPPAVRLADYRVRGRINALAFSPSQPVLALGTGARTVVVWNFHLGARERVIAGPDAIVGQVAYTAAGTLTVGERGQRRRDYAIFTYGAAGLRVLGSHQRSITALEPVGRNVVLSTSRDGTAALWDVSTGLCMARMQYGFWPREARVAPDGSHAALLHDGVTIVSLPSLIPSGDTQARKWQGVGRAAAFTPTGDGLVVGKFNGDVVAFGLASGRFTGRARPVLSHPGQVQAVESIPNRSLIVTAGSDGSVAFVSWPQGTMLGQVHAPGDRLLSLHVSHDGSFMATGDAAEHVSLWDLRVLDVAALFQSRLSTAKPGQLRAVEAIASDSAVDSRLRQGSRYLAAVLRYRFRHAIQVEDTPGIRPGSFDIEVN